MSGFSAVDSVKQQGTELNLTTKQNKQNKQNKQKNRDSQNNRVRAGTHFVKTGDKTLSTAFTELDKTETTEKDFQKRWD